MSETPIWYREAISRAVEDALTALSTMPFFSAFYLAGGTGLALKFGHRCSVDLDFFSAEPVDEEALLAALRPLTPLSVLGKAPQTLHLLLRGTKVSFIGYPYPLLFSTATFSGVKVADPRDIACMKLSAIASRGTRRDFVDLYVAAKAYTLGELLALFQRKFAGTDYNRVHLLKSLSYFEDAESDPPLAMLTEIPWAEVKSFFNREVPALL